MIGWLHRLMRCPVAPPEPRPVTQLDEQVERIEADTATCRRKLLEEVDATTAKQSELRYALDTRKINRLTELAEETLKAARGHHP